MNVYIGRTLSDVKLMTQAKKTLKSYIVIRYGIVENSCGCCLSHDHTK